MIYNVNYPPQMVCTYLLLIIIIIIVIIFLQRSILSLLLYFQFTLPFFLSLNGIGICYANSGRVSFFLLFLFFFFLKDNKKCGTNPVFQIRQYFFFSSNNPQLISDLTFSKILSEMSFAYLKKTAIKE